ncbi:hypothetical protein QN277_018039 [Acacia crassicarpa]|uniref:GDSL esterase/lipase n=1 Tax=Acacia crassicarpa TaxID=499986 RepID=A0AAE1JPQ8_9FABA|nr:hypothetical protein QN277_018039 [Acacia crassicarpa]
MASPTTHFTLLHIFTILVATSNAWKPKFSSILVFGDSTVDPGNNNFIETFFKGNHFPYGRDFPGHVPTGRYSNGKLVSDFVASILGIKETVPPYLDPNLSDHELLTGVSFASGGSGLDDLTTVASGVIPVSKQIEYFREYVEKIKCIVGKEEAEKMLERALVIISAGTNDFSLNFYDLPIRKHQFVDISRYQDFVQNRLQIFIKELYNLGCRKIAVVGLPPIGCIPLQITAKFKNPKDRKCIEQENLDSELYNKKLERLLLQVQATLPGCRVVYTDVYNPLANLINQPEKYGFLVTKRGCCGSGILEAGPLCNELTPTCEDASKFVFWDSVHPTEAAYKYITKYVEEEAFPKFGYSNSSQIYL